LNDVRVTYSGLIAFVVSIISVITGTIFVIMVTRRLEPEDLGLWTLAGSLVSYVIIVRPMITYWSTRQLSRGEDIGKTTIFTSGTFSIFSTIGYLGFVLYFTLTTDVDLNVLLLTTILVPLSFFYNSLNSIAISKRPQAISYGLVLFETIKIPMGLLLVVIFDLEVIGAILTVIVADFARIIVVAIMVRKHIRGEIRIEYIKFWIQMSWLTIYRTFANFIRTLDIFVFTVLTGSLIGLAYWGVAKTISALVIHSEKMTQGLYPKIIATKKKEYAEEALKRTLFLAIPTFGMTMIFVKPILYILNPVYVDGTIIAIVMTMRGFAFMFNNISFQLLSAFDTVDENKQLSVKKYLNSKLFFLPTLYYISSGTYIVVLAFYLFFADPETSDVELVITWSIIYLAVTIPLTIYGMISIKVKHNVSFPVKATLNYIIFGLISSGVTYLLLENYVVYAESIYDFVPQLIPLFFINVILYFGMCYIFDPSTKKLTRLIINEFKR
jgi:O-antigen/teichoic acid export membrane protein